MTEQATRLLVLRNLSSDPCKLDGYPNIGLLDAGGATLPFSYHDGGDQMITRARPTAVDLRPHGAAYVAINKNSCVNFTRLNAARVRVTPPGSESAISLKLARYPVLNYCGPGTLGHTIDVTPVEPTASATYTVR